MKRTINIELTPHDLKLVEEAYRTPYIEWWNIDEQKAETDAGMRELSRIKKYKYFEDEASVSRYSI